MGAWILSMACNAGAAAYLKALELALALLGLLLLPHAGPHVCVDHIRALHCLMEQMVMSELSAFDACMTAMAAGSVEGLLHL